MFQKIRLSFLRQITPVLLIRQHSDVLCQLAFVILLETAFRFPFGGFLKKRNSIPIHRENMNIRTVRTILNKIKDGKGLLIFPEEPELMMVAFKRLSLIGFILEMANVPIVRKNYRKL